MVLAASSLSIVIRLTVTFLPTLWSFWIWPLVSLENLLGGREMLKEAQRPFAYAIVQELLQLREDPVEGIGDLDKLVAPGADQPVVISH